MMKLTLHTCVNDAQHVRKRCTTREKEMENGWVRMQEHVRKRCATRDKGMGNRWEELGKPVRTNQI